MVNRKGNFYPGSAIFMKNPKWPGFPWKRKIIVGNMNFKKVDLLRIPYYLQINFTPKKTLNDITDLTVELDVGNLV